MNLPNIDALSDSGLLSMYARAKTNMLMCSMFKQIKLHPDIVKFVRELSREISERGLDQKHGHEN